jgi:hypothetical protein
MIKTLKNLMLQAIPADQRWKMIVLEHWPSIIGDLHSRVFISKIEGSTLFLSASHPAWAQELSYLEPAIKKNINDLFKKPVITSIRFVCQNRHKQGETRVSKPIQKAPEQSCVDVILSPEEKRTLAPITNSELQSELEAYLIRCKKHKKG